MEITHFYPRSYPTMATGLAFLLNLGESDHILELLPEK